MSLTQTLCPIIHAGLNEFETMSDNTVQSLEEFGCGVFGRPNDGEGKGKIN